MASLALDRTWVNLVSTGQSVKAKTARGRSHERSKDGEVLRLAGGRYRAVTTLGTRRSQSFVLRDVSQFDCDRLEAWAGETVLIRDKYGRRMFGTYLTIKYIDRVDPALWFDVQLDVVEVSYEEGSL